MSVEVKTHTALHILKGAIQKVLGAKWTSGVYVNGNHGRLVVQFDRRPKDNEIIQIEEEANEKIVENVPVEELILDRAEAEKRWGDAIYDLFPLPPSITQLNIFHIQGWNVNACKAKHTKTTGEVGRLRILKTRYREAKKLLEVSFDIQNNEEIDRPHDKLAFGEF
ncbi:alanyl-tRNA editing protein [Candidatus Bathyarchaeota archaeon]|nr:alanyl-tRNA editing protein [Candidatus Bathyarchaeota archaeon]